MRWWLGAAEPVDIAGPPRLNFNVRSRVDGQHGYGYGESQAGRSAKLTGMDLQWTCQTAGPKRP
jgi:hypothetical protein